MNRNDEEKLTDIVIGEAILALLQNGGAVSTAALMSNLQRMISSETDIRRKQACQRAIDEVHSSVVSMKERQKQAAPVRGNVRPVFSGYGLPDDPKKH